MEERIARFNQLLAELLQSKPVPFNEVQRGLLPTKGGIYRISLVESTESMTAYVGKTKDLRERLYTNHIMGNLVASSLKNKLVKSGACADVTSAKQLLLSNYQVQYILLDDKRERTFFEHFAVAILQPILND